PEIPPVVAVTVCVPTVLLVVNVICATPAASVLTGFAPTNEPPPVLLNVTALPAVAIELLLASASWARIVTELPAIGVELFDVTMYLVAAPAVNVTIALFVIAEPPTVPVIVAAPLWVPAVSVARYWPGPVELTAPRLPNDVASTIVEPPTAAILLSFA